MGGKALANDTWETKTTSYILTDWPQDDEIERELRLVEDLILTLDAADAFIEDLVSLHVRRNALTAALSIHRRKPGSSLVTLESWYQRAAETSRVANDCVAQRDRANGAGEREPDREG
jgi:hypothetical protein